MVFVLLVALLAAVVFVHVRFRLETVAAIRGLRQDVEHLARETSSLLQSIMTAHAHGAQALDRLMYYTKVSMPLGRLGRAYDHAVTKAKAKAAAEREAQIEAAKAADTSPAETPADLAEVAADEQDAQVVGSIGIPCE